MNVDGEGKVSATVELHVGDHELTVEMRLPARRTRPGELLPLYRGLAEQLIGFGVADAAEAGRTVSCRKGCGACCRQVVPISELEARRLREVVAGLPEARRAVILERFATARRRLAEAGFLEPLLAASPMPVREGTEYGLRYLAAGVPCPFLEDEACSIYDERPIICREYLVTSPPENCGHPTREGIAAVRLPGSVFHAVRWLTASDGAATAPWVPLILALEWAEAHPEPAPTRTGPELARALFGRLQDASAPVTDTT